MAAPNEGRSSSNEFFKKDVSLSDAKANDKLIEHAKAGIGGSSKTPDNALSYNKELEKQKEAEELGFSDSISVNDEDEYEDESTISGENLSTKARKRKRRSTPIKSIAFKLFYFLSQLREMFIRRFLRAFSHIFHNLGKYERGKVLNEANYQQLSSASNGVLKLKKMVKEAKNEVSNAKNKLKQYMKHDYKDPRNFVRDAASVLKEEHKVSVGGGIKIELSAKELMEDVNSVPVAGIVRAKAQKEFKEEAEEIKEADAIAKMHGLPERNRNFDERKNLKRKLSFASKPMTERISENRHNATSFRAVDFKRALPSLKRFIEKNDIKIKIKTTWASLAKRILYKAKPYSERLRSQKLLKYEFTDAFRLPASKARIANFYNKNDSYK